MAFDNKPITECYWGTGKGRVWLVGWEHHLILFNLWVSIKG